MATVRGVLVRLKTWKWLGNGGLVLSYDDGDGLHGKRFVPAGGTLTIADAARVLGVNDMFIYRRAKRGAFRLGRKHRKARMALTDVRHLRHELNQGG